MKKIKKILNSCICLVLATVMLATPITTEAAAPIASGIDVSIYQGSIRWPEVASTGISFAMIRLGTTKKGIDPYFAVNMQGASSVGIRTGVYVYSYATTPEQAAVEANMVLQNVQDKIVSFPIAIDLEDSVQAGLSPTQLADIANTFCSIIQGAGYYPMIYANKNWFTNRIGATGFDKWVAQYGPVCEYPNPAIWQYTSSGAVAGINGRVDMNYLFKDYASIIIPNGFVNRNGKTYYYNNFRMQMGGWADINGGKYLFNPAGEMQTGWFADGVNTQYLQPDGRMQIGLADIEGHRYYFNENGLMQIGLVDINGSKYFFDNTGKMQIGWVNTGIASYYFKPDGMMSVGWTDINNKRYYFNEAGEMTVGLTKIADKSYLFDVDGTMKTGWVGDDQVKFYFLMDGAMAMGWQTIDGGMYYFKEDGTMNKGLLILDNVKYYNDEITGKLVTGWKQIGPNWYLFGPDGILAVNTTLDVNGTLCQFDVNGVLVAPAGYVPVPAPAQ